MPTLFKPRQNEDAYVIWSSILGTEPLSKTLTSTELIDEVTRGISELADTVPEIQKMIDKADRLGCSDTETEQWDKAQVVYNDSGDTFIISHADLGEYADRYYENEDVDASDLVAPETAELLRD